MKYLITILILIASVVWHVATTEAQLLGATILFPSGGGTGISTNPTYGQLLVGNSGGTYTLTSTSSLGISGGGGTPGGSNTHVQFNNAGAFGGSANFTFDGSNVFIAGDLTVDDDINGGDIIQAATGFTSLTGYLSLTGQNNNVVLSAGTSTLAGNTFRLRVQGNALVSGTTTTANLTATGTIQLYTTDGTIFIGDLTASPFTRTGIMFGTTTGVFSETNTAGANDPIISFGANVNQLGGRNTARAGVLFRGETRACSGLWGDRCGFVVKLTNENSSTELTGLELNASTGNLTLGATDGSNGIPGAKLGVGTTTPRASLSIHGDTLISGSTTVASLTATGTIKTIGRYIAGAGTVLEPAYSFTSELDSGFFNPSPDVFGFSINQVQVMTLSDSQAAFANPIRGPAGNVTSPTYSWDLGASSNTGIYLPQTDTIGFTCNSTLCMRLTATGTLAIGTTTLKADPGTIDPKNKLVVQGDVVISGTTTANGFRATSSIETVGLQVTNNAAFGGASDYTVLNNVGDILLQGNADIDIPGDHYAFKGYLGGETLAGVYFNASTGALGPEIQFKDVTGATTCAFGVTGTSNYCTGTAPGLVLGGTALIAGTNLTVYGNAYVSGVQLTGTNQLIATTSITHELQVQGNTLMSGTTTVESKLQTNRLSLPGLRDQVLATTTALIAVEAGSTTINFPSTARNASSQATTTVVGARKGDLCTVNSDYNTTAFLNNRSNAAFDCVAIQNAVVFTFHNLDAATKDPPGGNIWFVLKRYEYQDY